MEVPGIRGGGCRKMVLSSHQFECLMRISMKLDRHLATAYFLNQKFVKTTGTIDGGISGKIRFQWLTVVRSTANLNKAEGQTKDA